MWCNTRMHKTLSTELSGNSISKADICKRRTRFTTSAGWAKDATSSMDAELSALVARRDKTRDLKQAMMQELLTGRTRLI